MSSWPREEVYEPESPRLSLKEASDIALGLFSWDISASYYQLGARFTLKLHPGHQRIALAILGPRSHAVNSGVDQGRLLFVPVILRSKSNLRQQKNNWPDWPSRNEIRAALFLHVPC